MDLGLFEVNISEFFLKRHIRFQTLFLEILIFDLQLWPIAVVYFEEFNSAFYWDGLLRRKCFSTETGTISVIFLILRAAFGLSGVIF